MNVFILCTGRCASATLVAAAKHLTNYSAAHESRTGLLGKDRLNYPENHIEADNRLSWFLGGLEQAYGNRAIYVHLKRNADATARSYARRYYHGGIILAYKTSILQGCAVTDPVQISQDYVHAVNANIEAFLKGKSRKMPFLLENAETDFRTFWELIEGRGDFQSALLEWKKTYNASPVRHKFPFVPAVLSKIRRVARELPSFLRNA